MGNILLYIKSEQLDWVFSHGDVGTGQKNFQRISRPGDLVFVLSTSHDGLTIFGEIPVAETYVDEKYPHGWKYRVRASAGGAVRYPTGVLLRGVKTYLTLLKGVKRIWPRVRYCCKITDEDAKTIRESGGI